LAKYFHTRIHVDHYKMSVYSSLVQHTLEGKQILTCPEAATLVGHIVGNTPQPGCLTHDETMRIHSCERPAGCQAVQRAKSERKLVHIQPVVSTGADMDAHIHIDAGSDGSALAPNYPASLAKQRQKDVLFDKDDGLDGWGILSPQRDDGFRQTILFPYSRHSSLPELRHLVSSLRPRDVRPCTFDVYKWACNSKQA